MKEDVVQSTAFGCVASTIKLRSGSYFDFLDPQPEQFTLEDIAGALSKICRFGGQCPRFYSVAEHSIHCYRQATEDGRSLEERAAVLFHDAPEAFCGDVVKPLKLLLRDYAAIEKRVENCIGAALGIDFAAHTAVIREIDHAMLIAERRELFGSDGVKWFGEDEVRKISPKFMFYETDLIEAAFLNAVNEILGVTAEIRESTVKIGGSPIGCGGGMQRCEHCGSDRIYYGPPDCPSCGAPNCCQMCCKIASLELQLDESKQTIKKLNDQFTREKSFYVTGDEYEALKTALGLSDPPSQVFEKAPERIAALRAIVEPLNRLRANEGASVEILCDNPEGPPNCAIRVSDDWTGDEWDWKRFEGETLAECLSKALEAKVTAEKEAQG
jgi:hypothetical protein